MHQHTPDHDDGSRPAATLLRVLLIIAGFGVVEAVAGWWSGSLALLGDAGHMATDAGSLALALLAQWVARRPPSSRHSYGLGRAEVVGALVNGLLMLGVVVAVVVAAVGRLHAAPPVDGVTVMAVAAAGLLVNVVAAVMLSRGEQTLNMRGALLHVMGDLAGSVAALLAGAVIFFTGWMPIDPILSLLICVLILYSTGRLLRDTLNVIMEGVPPHLDLHEIGLALAARPGVHSVHDLHVWTLSSGTIALSAHVVLRDLERWQTTLADLRVTLAERFGIDHVTLQPETHEQPLHPLPAGESLQGKE